MLIAWQAGERSNYMFSNAVFRSAWLLAPVNITLKLG
jgi:hypothetical protein